MVHGYDLDPVQPVTSSVFLAGSFPSPGTTGGPPPAFQAASLDAAGVDVGADFRIPGFRRWTGCQTLQLPMAGCSRSMTRSSRAAGPALKPVPQFFAIHSGRALPDLVHHGGVADAPDTMPL
jgi:hypothetical protein